MRIVFRTDASNRIGTGHVMRCRALALALRKRGAAVSFVCRDLEGHPAELLRNDGLQVSLLPARAPIVPEINDADEAITAIDRGKTDWLVVDHYGLSASWESRLRPHAERILAIDDLADRPHACDLLLDQNFALAGTNRYATLIGPECRALLGPHYALLAGVYASGAQPARASAGPVRRIVVYFGGADTGNMTGRTLEALTDPAFAEIDVEVVAGASHPARAALETLAAARPRTHLQGPRASLIELLAAADIAIGAGGITTWERCFMGVPSVVVSIAANQVPSSRDLSAVGIVEYLGAHEQVTAESLRRSIAELCADVSRRQAMAERGQLLVDGQGVRRVVEVMDPTSVDALTLRAARHNDAAFYFRLVNDPDVRRESFQDRSIPWDEHVAWFSARLHDSRTQLFVMEADGLPVGQIRFDRRDGEALLSYALEAFVRGRGWGTHLVSMGLGALDGSDAAIVKAEVKPGNAASRHVFEKLGFAALETGTRDKITYIRK